MATTRRAKNIRELDLYQDLAEEFASYPDRGSVTSLIYPTNGLTSEAGEVADLFKKAYRAGEEVDREKLKTELGDVLWYVAELASLHEISLAAIAEANIAKLDKRVEDGTLLAANRGGE